MDTFSAITARRAVKAFDPNHKISDEELHQLLSHTLLSPTAFNIQNWRFVVVSDPEVRREIRAAAFDQAQVTDASALVVLTANKKAYAENPSRYWENAPKEVADYLVPMIGQYYEGRESVQVDEGHRSCGMAGMTLMLAAKALGYDTCPMDGFDFDAVGKIINLPENHIISFMIAIGKGIKPAYPRGGQLPLEEIVIQNKFS